MTSMMPYYLSRGLLAVGFGLVFLLTGSPWWEALLTSAIVCGWFLLAPNTGRYSVHPELGVAALRRDERNEMINDKAARNAFVIAMLALAAVTIYFGRLESAAVPLSFLKWILVAGAGAYFAFDFWLRKRM